MRERRIRQEKTLGKVVFFVLGVIFSHWRRRRKGGGVDWIYISGFTGILLEDFYRGHLLLGILGLGVKKP